MASSTPYSRTLQTPRLVLKLFDPTNPDHYTNQLSLISSGPVKKVGVVPLANKEFLDDKCERQRIPKELCTKLGEGIDPPSHSYILIYLRDSNGDAGTYIGGISFFHRRKTGLMPDIGWGLMSEEYHGKRYGTEAAGAALKFWREEIGVLEICSLTDAKNVAAKRVAEKIGMVDGGSFKLEMPNGEIKDFVAMMLPGMKKLEDGFQLKMSDLA
jgi:RimJ/RimL family protein N-acetyltransferase